MVSFMFLYFDAATTGRGITTEICRLSIAWRHFFSASSPKIRHLSGATSTQEFALSLAFQLSRRPAGIAEISRNCRGPLPDAMASNQRVFEVIAMPFEFLMVPSKVLRRCAAENLGGSLTGPP